MPNNKGPTGALLALTLTLIATACGNETATDSGAHTVVFGCTPAYSGLPRMIAEDLGLDEEFGLEIQCSSIESGPEVTAALVSGEIGATQLIPGNLTPLLDQEESLVAFAGINTIESFQLLIRSDYDLPNESEGWEGVMQDLEGGNIGVVTRGGAAEFLTRALFEQAGIDPEAQTYLPTAQTAAIAALSAGQIDAAMATEPTQTLAVHDGAAVQPFTIGDETGPAEMQWGSMLLAAGTEYAQENSETLCRLKNVYAEAIDHIRDPDNRDHVVEVMESEMNLETEVAELILERNVDTYPETIDVDPELWDPNFAFLHETGVAEDTYTAGDYSMDVCA